MGSWMLQDANSGGGMGTYPPSQSHFGEPGSAETSARLGCEIWIPSIIKKNWIQ